MRSRRVDVTYSIGDSRPLKRMTGKKTVILMQDDNDEVDLTTVNMKNMDDVCDVLEDALEEAKRVRSLMQSSRLNGLIANC